MRRTLVALFVACALAAAACHDTTIVDHFPPPPKLVIAEPMPGDFGIALWMYDDKSPRTALDVDCAADGRAHWRVWVPATKQEIGRGTYSLDSAQIASVWRCVVDANFDTIAAGTVSPDVCSDGASGIQRFAVRSGGAERYVWRAPGVTDVEGIRRAMLATLPAEATAAFHR